MALQHPVPGATLTQKYGLSAIGAEPAMFANSTRAYWQPFNGGSFYNHWHPALDLAAPAGTAIVASEAGRVVESYFDGTNGGGNKVTVEIRPNVRYTSNHMQSRAVGVGASVKRGQKIGTVGTTGWSTGNHDHFQVTIKETDAAGVARTFMYNPSLFLSGGSMSGDPRIQPISAPASTAYLRLNGPGINIRVTPDLDVGSGNVYAWSTENGIWRSGEVRWPLNQKMKFGGWVANDDGAWAKVYLGNHYRYVKKELIHFV
jgi:hypothetical protein